MLIVLSLYSPDNTYDDLFLSNYASLNLYDHIARIYGVGNISIVGEREYAMRLWVRPDRLAALGLTARDVAQAVQDQNVQAPAGQVGQPPAKAGLSFQYTVDVKGRLTDQEEFDNIIVRTLPDGSVLRVRDIGSHRARRPALHLVFPAGRQAFHHHGDLPAPRGQRPGRGHQDPGLHGRGQKEFSPGPGI